MTSHSFLLLNSWAKLFVLAAQPCQGFHRAAVILMRLLDSFKSKLAGGWMSGPPYLFPCTTAPGSLDKASSSCTSSTRVLKHTLFTLQKQHLRQRGRNLWKGLTSKNTTSTKNVTLNLELRKLALTPRISALADVNQSPPPPPKKTTTITTPPLEQKVLPMEHLGWWWLGGGGNL